MNFQTTKYRGLYATSMSVIKSRTPEQQGKVKSNDFVVGTK